MYPFINHNQNDVISKMFWKNLHTLFYTLKKYVNATEGAIIYGISMMLIHCHPSGNVFPSKADTMMTDRMNKLCELMGIPLIDHIIVGGDNREFFSFREKGMIDNPKITLSTDYRTLDIKSPLVAEQGKAR